MSQDIEQDVMVTHASEEEDIGLRAVFKGPGLIQLVIEGCFSELRLRIDVSWGKNVLARENSKYRSLKQKRTWLFGETERRPLYQNPNSRDAACSLLSKL